MPGEEMLVEVTRPGPEHWLQILEVLQTATFHHIGSDEMREFPLEDCFVATVDGTVRAVGGYRILGPREAKTTLLAAHPDFAHLSFGALLQSTRLHHLRSLGIRRVTTNTDDQRVAR